MVISLLYAFVSLWLAVYSFHSLYLLWLFHKNKGPRKSPYLPQKLPYVTVQLPIFNEFTTIERLLSAIAALDYPRTLLQIQVLDDSSDETAILTQRLVSHWQSDGLDISHIQRRNRKGFKAGALANGMKTALGEFVAIFDADFIPPPDFLKRIIPWFNDSQIGCVQSRWGHLNRNYSLLTKLQAMAIDAHFMVEQTARSRSGLFLNFNGSAGVWRKDCIVDSGGWQSGTLTEDFDLSYRAQLKGWRIEYLTDLVVPAELPVQMTAFKQQQARWARGSMQTAKKLLPSLLKSKLPLRLKLSGSLHLTHYLVHPLLLIALILSLLLHFQESIIFQWIPLLMISALVSPLLYLSSPAPEAPHWSKRLKLIPALMLISIGISLNNTKAALIGLFKSEEGNFVRTPKYAIQHAKDRWEFSRYSLIKNPWSFGELLLLLLTLWGLLQAFQNNNFFLIPWLLLYGSGYGLIAVISFEQSIRRMLLRS